jgi:hypothetical protein
LNALQKVVDEAAAPFVKEIPDGPIGFQGASIRIGDVRQREGANSGLLFRELE